jgi:1-acyl-sn-glycerol-3-phosphate acyltransferase
MTKQEKNYSRRYAKEYNIFRWWFHIFAIVVAYPYLKWAYNIKAFNKKNIPKGSHYIVAPNHVSMFDPLMITICTVRPIAYMAKKELFDKNCNLNWWIKHLGAFSVDREKPEISTFKTIKDVFKTNWALGIFPEGHINTTQRLENVQKGFVTIAKKSKCDILPVAICGFKGYTKKFHNQDIEIKFGEPISYELSEDEMLNKWAEFICKETGFENKVKEEIETLKV